MKWLIGIGIGLLTVIWLAFEMATVEDRGRNGRSFFTAFKRSVIFVIPLFAVGGGVYYLFFH